MFRGFLENYGDAPHFNYQGSKASIRRWVIQYMPPSGRWYIEPFGGRGNMFFLAKKTLQFKNWHINDLNSASFFQGIKDVDVQQFPQKMTLSKFQQFKTNSDELMSKVLEPGISHLGHYRGGFKYKYGKNQIWDKNQYSQKILQAREHLNDVKITNVSWDALPYSKYTSQDFIYFDPPYLDTDNRYYKDINHLEFLKTVKSLKARWMISHIYHPLYVLHLGEPFQTKKRNARLKTPTSSGSVLVECLWKGNY